MALQRGFWLLGGCPVLAPTVHSQPWARRLPPDLGKHGPRRKSSFGKSLKAHVPQRASSPSAVTRWIWYSEFWSIWRRTWCDLQRGNRDRLPGKETKFFPYLCHQPHCHYYSLSQHFGSALRGNNTLTWHYFCAHPSVLHQNRLTSLSCCYR